MQLLVVYTKVQTLGSCKAGVHIQIACDLKLYEAFHCHLLIDVNSDNKSYPAYPSYIC